MAIPAGAPLSFFFARGEEHPYLSKLSKDELKTILGGKGYGVYRMICQLGLKCPAMFNLPTYHANNLAEGKLTPELRDEVCRNIALLEKATGKKFGSPENPLLVSARSGAKFSMPGMMDTILNIGLNDEIVEALVKAQPANARFWYDAYRRLLEMIGDVVYGIAEYDAGEETKDRFEEAMEQVKHAAGVTNDAELTADHLKTLCGKFKEIYKSQGQEFPSDPVEQVCLAAEAVFRSWNTPRAIFTRKEDGIPDDLGTAVNIQEMVFGNKTPLSGTGVFFTRDKSTGHKTPGKLDGTVLFQAQGEDVVAGRRNSEPLEVLLESENEHLRAIYNEIKETGDLLERAERNMQDTEFTIEENAEGVPILYWLQIRDGKRSALAESVIAVNLAKEGIITEAEAVLMVNPKRFEEQLYPRIPSSAKQSARLLGKGTAASPGPAAGAITFTKDQALEDSKTKDVVLCTVMTNQNDVPGMKAAVGILTSTGTKVSHAAIMATAWGVPAVVGASCVSFGEDSEGRFLEIDGTKLRRGDVITIDGASGEIFLGALPSEKPSDLSPEAEQIIEWAKKLKSLQIRANAERAEAQISADRGAEGIGLFRTEHMFLGERLGDIQTVLFGADEAAKVAALDRIAQFSKSDFKDALRIMNGYGVTIRLLDAPLHEFFPEDSHLEREENPMLGFRSVRMCYLNPEIARMQAWAILTAAAELQKEGLDPHPEIELPLVIIPEEVAYFKKLVAEVAVKVHEETGVWVHYGLGIMVETPAAALQGTEMVRALEAPVCGVPAEAQSAKGFASFGTNDLTQTTLAISRDDADRFLPRYVEDGMFALHPFLSLHPVVERIVRQFVAAARQVDPKFEIFICGEHGGDLYTIGRLHDMGFTGTSMSPGGIYRSILQAAHEQIKNPR